VTYNLLLWKWSDDYDTPQKRKKHKLKFSDITSAFLQTGTHPAIGDFCPSDFRAAIDENFGADEDFRPFVFEEYDHCIVINYPNAVRFQLVPKIANIGRQFGLNASEF